MDLQCFRTLLNASSLANKSHILSASAPHAFSWLTVVPTVELGVHLDPSELGVHLDPSELGVHLDPSELGVHLDPSELGVHLDPSEYSIAIQWWLGVDTSGGLPCPLCSDIALDPLGHHAATCRRGGDVVLHHIQQRDAFVGFCHQAHLSVKVEGGSGLIPDMSHSRPADVLVRDWAQGKPAAFDIMATSPFSPAILAETSLRVGAAAEAAERRKHAANEVPK